MDKNFKVVVIDDNKEMAGAIRQLLEVRGIAVLGANNGRSGLDLVDKEKPDMIILDIVMPDMDGRDVLTLLKSSDQTKNIPVILLTGRDEKFDKNYGIKLGAYDYVSKPYDSAILLKHINDISEKKNLGEL